MNPPNILLIVLDSARADHFSCYGYDLRTTPNIDGIAAEGVRFDAAYAESSWTLPAAFSLLTGLAPREHQAESVRALPADLPTLPALLRRKGYNTFGGTGNDFFGPRTGLDRGFQTLRSTPQIGFWTQAFYRYGWQRLGLSDFGGHLLARWFLHWVQHTHPPWFAVLWLNEPHHPYSAPWPFTTRLLRRPISFFRRVWLTKRMRRMLSLASNATQDDILDVVGLYDGCLAYADHLVGLTRRGLEQYAQWDETTVIILADHGEMLGERGLLGHGRTADMYRPLLRVPLIVRVPGAVKPGTVSTSLVQLADVAATLAGLAGVGDELADTAAERVDLREAAAGRGRTMAVSERQPLSERAVVSARRKSPEFNFTPHLCHMAAVVHDGWRLIHRADGRHELYYIERDPNETEELSAQQPQRLRELVHLVERWQTRVVAHPSTAALRREDDAIVEKRLQDLGYF